ncbi:MAG: bifunctional histidinol-phosphatase/imidazoleglycerol-phosphate dehydratase HisB [Succinivibrionaceae bacterium]|nr:bifunctional histidinol-phosphatase/imidazoleglycerol-phosphate dehydratase HisB [Succinivibrionaceae bacterium]
MKRYLFVDRDGTLIEEPADEQVDRLGKIRLKPGVIPALLRLRDLGYAFVMVSNQDGLGTESFPLMDFNTCHEFILNLFSSQGIGFEQVLICPHRPGDGCACRKPRTGLVAPYLADQGWDRSRSAFVGDRESDLEMARAMGIRGYMLGEGLSWAQVADDLALPRRTARICRATSETEIEVEVDLDRPGRRSIDTGIGFFDHMLDQIATHGNFSLSVHAKGDLKVDCHHTIEDTGLALGQALREALGDKRGIGRFGFALPMDEVHAEAFGRDALAEDPGVAATLDISGRPHVEFSLDARFTRDQVGEMPVQMVPHFFESLAMSMGLTLHLAAGPGNAHHQVEALFKCFGRALRGALAITGTALPSTKGSL